MLIFALVIESFERSQLVLETVQRRFETTRTEPQVLQNGVDFSVMGVREGISRDGRDGHRWLVSFHRHDSDRLGVRVEVQHGT